MNALIYLALMVVVAAIGISSLLWQQRRQRAHIGSVEGFNEALKAISPQSPSAPVREPRKPVRGPSRGRAPGRPAPLDAQQRARARQRVEQRRLMEARRRAHRAQAARLSASRHGS